MIHNPYFMMTIVKQLLLTDYLRFQGDLKEFSLSLQGGLGGTPGGGVPEVSLSSDATRTDRTGTSVRSEDLSGVPVGPLVLYEKSCFLPSTHPTTWEGDTSAYRGFFRVEY